MAAGNQAEKGICALLVQAARITILATMGGSSPAPSL
jgi:hypothetical protein